ncbi:MAG: hypothetical protein NTY07_13705 [Bacteroidia bacterium]|nr:hypothetical protein [Bacteroidia bacterium]
MIKRKTLRILLWIILAGIVVATSAVYYVFNKPRRNISKESAVYTMEAKQLISEFKKDEDSATKKYLDKTITVKGEIKSIRTLDNQSKVFSLEDEMEGVSCTVDSADVVKNYSKLTQFTKGSNVTFKGRCSGMLMDIQIINCVPE